MCACMCFTLIGIHVTGVADSLSWLNNTTLWPSTLEIACIGTHSCRHGAIHARDFDDIYLTATGYVQYYDGAPFSYFGALDFAIVHLQSVHSIYVNATQGAITNSGTYSTYYR